MVLSLNPPRSVHFGKDGDTWLPFCKNESVFTYQIRFRGRYEKELEYRKKLYTGIIYSNPSKLTIGGRTRCFEILWR